MTLKITVLEKPVFYSLYADGIFSYKTFDKISRSNLFYYDKNALVILYYTYPAYREACVIRNTGGDKLLPGLSKKVLVLFTLRSSKVDKLRRAMGFLRENFPGAYEKDDGFYLRLYFILLQRGKINYPALKQLAKSYQTNRENTF